MGFDDDSGDGTQVNISNIQAALGIYFKPANFGFLYVQSSVVITETYGYQDLYTGCNARGWAGFLVQGYNDTNSLVEMPVYQQYILYDKGSNGGYFQDEPKNNIVNIVFTTPWFFVRPNMWYAIWLWCGGDIHAEGWVTGQPQPSLSDFGSSAWSQMDVSVPSFMLHFRSSKAALPIIPRNVRPKSTPIHRTRPKRMRTR